MSTSKVVKAIGLKSVVEVAEMTGKDPDTIRNWHKKDPDFFEIVIMGCVAKRTQLNIQKELNKE